MPDRKTIRGFYKSRFIDSLENDYDQWEVKYCGASSGDSWIEYHGPEYTNKEGERIQFFSGLSYTGAYINGCVGYAIPFWEWIFQTRLKRAYRKMKKHAHKKRAMEINKELMKAL